MPTSSPRRRVRYNYTLSAETVAAVSRIAEAEDVPRSRVIDLAVRELVRAREAGPR